MTGLDRETLDGVLASLHEFAAQHLTLDTLLALDARDEFPEALVRRMCGPELGIHLLFIPEEFNGMGGGAFDTYRLCEQMARIDLGIATGLFATFLGSDPIAVGGTPEQRRYWLTRIADEGLIMAYGATEPAAGSDLAALRTTASPIERDGELVGYRLNGRKQWISNGGVADAATVLALAMRIWTISASVTRGSCRASSFKKNSTIGGSKRVPSWISGLRRKYDPVAMRRITTSRGIMVQRVTTLIFSPTMPI